LPQISPDGKYAYVTGFNLITGAGSVAEIDTATLKLTHTVPVAAFTVYSIVNPITNDVWTVGSVHASGGGFNAIKKGLNRGQVDSPNSETQEE
jgi:DNA-binding beta-propeller fold protein YncE